MRKLNGSEPLGIPLPLPVLVLVLVAEAEAEAEADVAEAEMEDILDMLGSSWVVALRAGRDHASGRGCGWANTNMGGQERRGGNTQATSTSTQSTALWLFILAISDLWMRANRHIPIRRLPVRSIS
ncbi:hypothetical protein IEO21_05696 [Rhodonia placenta]|uniref:Secreted protein n=1 Tax=Rhodonia placenta TaxID=104341 RepID=A0A8H7U222_9APHY|nr:hypothetical protein IEO21_05696 [Postia placenta]